MGWVAAVAITITSVTAILIEKAVFTFLDTPRNGQIPIKRESTILLVRIPAKSIVTIDVVLFITATYLFCVFTSNRRVAI